MLLVEHRKGIRCVKTALKLLGIAVNVSEHGTPQSTM